ARQ
ncbi:hypothetical protein D047_2116B, partial [Vibrio parahaemolyticus VPTS-2010_2]